MSLYVAGALFASSGGASLRKRRKCVFFFSFLLREAYKVAQRALYGGPTQGWIPLFSQDGSTYETFLASTWTHLPAGLAPPLGAAYAKFEKLNSGLTSPKSVSGLDMRVATRLVSAQPSKNAIKLQIATRFQMYLATVAVTQKCN